MFSYRITKYNPQNRNTRGLYQKDEWTAISDIGKIFNGKRASKTEYFKIENGYIQAIMLFMDFLKIRNLSILGLEKDHNFPLFNRHISGSMHKLYKTSNTGLALNKPQIRDMARLVLRELLWCKLQNDNMMFIHFGYDYYMYIGSSKELPQNLRNKIENLGLFVEDFESPYLPDNE